MDVAITDFRASLSSYVERARRGEDVVLTDRGVPVARLVPVDAAAALGRLEREGVVSPPAAPRSPAAGRSRATATGPVAEFVSDLRR